MRAGRLEDGTGLPTLAPLTPDRIDQLVKSDDRRSMDLTTTEIPMDNRLAAPRFRRPVSRKNFRLDVLLFLTLLLLVFFGLSAGAR